MNGYDTWMEKSASDNIKLEDDNVEISQDDIDAQRGEIEWKESKND